MYIKKKIFLQMSIAFTEDVGVLYIKISCQIKTSFKILSLMFQLDLNAERNTPPLALVYGMFMSRRFHELSRIQRLNTMLLSDGNASITISLKLLIRILCGNI